MSEAVAWKRFDLGALGAREEADRRAGVSRRAEDQQKAEAIGQQAWRAGFEAGRQAGAGEARRIAALADAFAAALRAAESDLAADLVDLAVEIARQVLRTDPKLRRDALIAVVREAMEALPEAPGRCQLALNPADLELVRGRAGEELAQQGWTLVEDHRIEPGGCRVVASHGDIDATLATRWRRVIAAFGSQAPWNDA